MARQKNMLAFILAGALISGAVTTALATTGDQPREGRLQGTIQVGNHPESAFPGLARVDINQALASAGKAAHGKVLKVELEDENGFLVYSVEMAGQSGQVSDVKVDAGTGKVLLVEQDRQDNDQEARGYGHDDEEGHEHAGREAEERD